MAGVVFRVDKKPFSDETYEVLAFCSKCDPDGKGGGPGVLGRLLKTGPFEKSNDLVAGYDVQRFSKYHCFCPTCGEKLDYTSRKVRENQMR